LLARGFDVRLKVDADPPDDDATRAQLVFVSSSASPAVLGTRLREMPVPVVVSAPGLYPAMGMTFDRRGEDFGSESAEGPLGMLVSEPDHPLAASRTEPLRVATRAAECGWGMPVGAASIAATLETDPSRATVFGYEAGASLWGLEAPARRVGFF